MFEDIINLIDDNDSIVIFGHVNPDGDCYGSTTAMREIILSNFKGKKVYISSSGVSNLFSLFGVTDTSVDDDIFKKSLGIVLDCRDAYMVEDQRYKLCKAICTIDHHICEDDPLPGPYISNSDACSTCEVITDFIRDTGLKINKESATMLLLGLITDSGRFQYAAHYDHMFDSAEYLVKQGGDISKIYHVLNIKESKDLTVKTYIYSNYQTSKHGVIYIAFSKETLKELGITLNEAASYVNTLGWLENYPIWIGFFEYPNHHMRAEFRSQTIPVQPIADSLGGGGHEFASGCTNIEAFNQKTIDDIVSRFDNEILKYQK
ncbi:MAG: bifunctional oligoribonuclease/PAP phosphatase NrnA [Coprobacillus sp.]|nr:bifunctional oligoribonuclease/PAP phosphatase NrnA [Coprobacillus sp.]